MLKVAQTELFESIMPFVLEINRNGTILFEFPKNFILNKGELDKYFKRTIDVYGTEKSIMFLGEFLDTTIYDYIRSKVLFELYDKKGRGIEYINPCIKIELQ